MATALRTAPRIGIEQRRMDRSGARGDNVRKGFFRFTLNEIRKPAVRVAIAPPPPPVDGPKPPFKPIFINPPTKYDYNNGWKGLETYLTMICQSDAVLGRQVSLAANSTMIYEAKLINFRLEGVSLNSLLCVSVRTYPRNMLLADLSISFEAFENASKIAAEKARQHLAFLIGQNVNGVCYGHPTRLFYDFGKGYEKYYKFNARIWI